MVGGLGRLLAVIQRRYRLLQHAAGYLSEDAYFGAQSLYIPEAWNAKYRTMLAEKDPELRNAAYRELDRMAIDDYCLLTPTVCNERSHRHDA